MLDGVSLDQLRTFIAAVDEGSFSAAARNLLRAQSMVSETVSNLEEQIGVPPFDRSGPTPSSRRQASFFSPTLATSSPARAKAMAVGLEPELSVVPVLSNRRRSRGRQAALIAGFRRDRSFAGKPVIVGLTGTQRQQYWKAPPDVIRLSEN